jgi:hypothetical protein
MRRSSNPSIEGYVFLSAREQAEAECWMSRYFSNPIAIEDGAAIGCEPIVYGLTEDYDAGGLSIPDIKHAETDQSDDDKRFNSDASRLSDLIDRALIRRTLPKHRIRYLRASHKQALDLWLLGYRQEHIAIIVGISRTAVTKVLGRTLKRLGVAC